MSQPETTVLKIGGSVITDKDEEMKARTQVIDRLAEEIQKANVNNLIIVHGGGSFGHPVAEKYRIKEGFKEDSQKIGFSETHHVMTMLNGLFMDSLVWHNVPAMSVTSSSCILTENCRIKHFEDSALKAFLKMGVVPVLYGDAVLDTKLGFTILSGDQLITALAMKFNSKRIIIGVDVTGIYDADPKTEKNAKIFTHLTLKELKELQNKFGKPSSCDVTGGMQGKMSELIPAVEAGIVVTIVDATKPNNVYKALKGEKVEGTAIKKE